MHFEEIAGKTTLVVGTAASAAEQKNVALYNFADSGSLDDVNRLLGDNPQLDYAVGVYCVLQDALPSFLFGHRSLSISPPRC